jgi:hypothetical protein
VAGAPESPLAVITRPDDDSPAVHAFVARAREHARELAP